MNRITKILSVILVFFTCTIFAQTTVSIPTLTSTENVDVTIPIETSAPISNIGAITFKIQYDPAVLVYKEIANNPFTGNFSVNNNPTTGVLNIGWFGITGVNVTNKLLDMVFQYKSGTSAITFVTKEIATTASQLVNATYVNGGIAPKAAELKLGTVTTAKNTTVKVPLTGASLKDVGSMQLFVSYDNVNVEFVGLENDLFGFSANAANGKVSLAGYNTAGFTLDQGTIANLVFKVVETSTDLNFTGNNEIYAKDGTTKLTVAFTNGKITVNVPQTSLKIPEVKKAKGVVNIPLNVIKVTDLGSFDIKVTYDKTKLTYKGYENLKSGTLVANEVNGVLSLSWFSTTGVTVTDETKFVDLQFDYAGGTSTLVLTSTSMTNVSGTNISVGLVDGKVYENAAPSLKATLADATVKENEVYTADFAANVTDADTSDVITYSFKLWKGETEVTAENGTLTAGVYTWTPGYAQSGAYTLILTAKDNDMIAVNDTVLVTVNNTNRLPVLALTSEHADNKLRVGYSHWIKLAATDEDGGTPTYTFLGTLADGQKLEGDTFTWAPLTAQIGTHKLSFVATDVDGGKDTTDITVSVIAPDDLQELPTVYSLSQNYPNPFNPSTTISYQLPKASYVKLQVVNILGQVVTELVDGVQVAGKHNITFNAKNINSGMYFYRISAKSTESSEVFNEVRKMMLVK